MRVQIVKARDQRFAFPIDMRCTRGHVQPAAHRDNAVPVYQHVLHFGRCTRPIEDMCAGDEREVIRACILDRKYTQGAE